MWYTYKKLPFIGNLYVEYNKDLTPLCGYEWERGELFLYVRKIRMIITLPSWKAYDQTRIGKRNGTTEKHRTNLEAGGKVSRIGRRNTDTNRGRVSRCG